MAGQGLYRSPKFNWNYPKRLIGEKIIDAKVHFCDVCALPILIYGRMLPCKHVFCLDCASKSEKICPRCKESVSRIERCEFGQIHLCAWGATAQGQKGCGRTYLSQRDLQAHVNHRHMPKTSSPAEGRQHINVVSSSQAVASDMQPIPQLRNTPTRGNLITIQLQSDDTETKAYSLMSSKSLYNH